MPHAGRGVACPDPSRRGVSHGERAGGSSGLDSGRAGCRQHGRRRIHRLRRSSWSGQRGSLLAAANADGNGRLWPTGGPVATEPIALTRQLRHPWAWPHRLTAVEVSPGGVSYGTPRGQAAVVYNARRHTLTVVINASGVTPGDHAAHIHMGSCESQGPVLYMIKDLVANRHGQIKHVVRVFTNVTMPIPAHGWYLNIHQGTGNEILHNGQPTIFFRPLICANIRPGAI